MITLVLVAIGVPCLGVLAFLGMRRIQSLPFAKSPALARTGDMRGIALQTIIIMVVLLAIAGAVATVLFSRASEETERLEDSESTEVYSITSETLCRTSGNAWKTGWPSGGGEVGRADRNGLNAADINAQAANQGWCDPTP